MDTGKIGEKEEETVPKNEVISNLVLKGKRFVLDIKSDLI